MNFKDTLLRCSNSNEFDIFNDVKNLGNTIGENMDVNAFNANMRSINTEFKYLVKKNTPTTGSYLFTLSVDKYSLDKWVEEEFDVILDFYHPHLEYSTDVMVKVMEIELAFMIHKFGQLHEIQYYTAVYKMLIKYFNVTDIANIARIPEFILDSISYERIQENAEFMNILKLNYVTVYNLLMYVKPEHIVEDIIEKYNIPRERLYKYFKLFPDDLRNMFGQVYPELLPVQHIWNPENVDDVNNSTEA